VRATSILSPGPGDGPPVQTWTQRITVPDAGPSVLAPTTGSKVRKTALLLMGGWARGDPPVPDSSRKVTPAPPPRA